MQILVGISDPLSPGCWYTHATYNSDSYRLLMGQPLHISEYHLCMVLKGVPQQYRQFRYASIVNSLSLLLPHWPRRHAPPAVSPPTISKTGHLQIEEDHQNDGCMVIGSLPINHPGKCSAQTFTLVLLDLSDGEMQCKPSFVTYIRTHAYAATIASKCLLVPHRLNVKVADLDTLN